MSWLQETHGTMVELVRLFLGRMLDGEWSSTPGEWQTVAVGAVALVLPSGLLISRSGTLEAGKYAHLSALASPEPFRAAAMADQLSLLTLVFAVTGLLVLIQWQALFPDRRDYVSLAGFPVRSKQIFLARFATVLIFSIALVILMNLMPCLVAPVEFGGRWQKNPSFLVNMGAQAAASGLGCFFVLFAIVAIQGVLLNTLPARLFARLSVWVQGALVAALLLAGLYSWSIRNWQPEILALLPQLGLWAPPVWFAGLHEHLLGDPDPFYRTMAERAILAPAAALVLAIATYLLSYRRYRTLLLEAPVRVRVPGRRQWSLWRLVCREPRTQAIAEFMAKTLSRSRSHRVLWLAYVGATLAVLINNSLVNGAFLAGRTGATAKQFEFLVLVWPIGASMVLLAGMRHTLWIPAELPANWIFRLNESGGRNQWMSAVERFVPLVAILPIYVLLFPLALRFLAWPLAIRMTILQVLVSISIFDLLFYGWQQLPFACSYIPGKRQLIGILTSYLAALGIAAPLLSLTIRAGAEFPELFPFHCALFLAVWIWARRRRRDGWGRDPLLYEDPGKGVPDLGIRELTYHSPAR